LWVYHLGDPLSLRVRGMHAGVGSFYREAACTLVYAKSSLEFLLGGAFQSVHMERMRGTPLEAYEYCEKSKTQVYPAVTYGKKPVGQGGRSDLYTFVSDAEKLQTGEMTVLDLQANHVPIEARHMKYFDRVIARNQPKRSVKTIGIVFYGPPGTGKTTRAHALAQALGCPDPYDLTLPKSETSELWWPRYAQESVVVIDEMESKRLARPDFGRLLDAKGFIINQKGGDTQFTSRFVIFTSNHLPSTWFPGDWVFVQGRLSVILRMEYAPGHSPDDTFSNRDECGEHARVVCEKNDGLCAREGFVLPDWIPAPSPVDLP